MNSWYVFDIENPVRESLEAIEHTWRWNRKAVIAVPGGGAGCTWTGVQMRGGLQTQARRDWELRSQGAASVRCSKEMSEVTAVLLRGSFQGPDGW